MLLTTAVHYSQGFTDQSLLDGSATCCSRASASHAFVPRGTRLSRVCTNSSSETEMPRISACGQQQKTSSSCAPVGRDDATVGSMAHGLIEHPSRKKASHHVGRVHKWWHLKLNSISAHSRDDPTSNSLLLENRQKKRKARPGAIKHPCSTSASRYLGCKPSFKLTRAHSPVSM